MIDYKCIPKAALDTVYVNQPQAYNAYIDNINANNVEATLPETLPVATFVACSVAQPSLR